MAARVEPAHGGAREALGRLRAVRGGDGGILAAVDEEDGQVEGGDGAPVVGASLDEVGGERAQDRKSTRLNSSHSQISYAVFCLKKKKKYQVRKKDKSTQDTLVYSYD